MHKFKNNKYKVINYIIKKNKIYIYIIFKYINYRNIY